MMFAKKVLFVRDFRGFTGGHLKVLHYIQHIASSGFARAEVLLSPDSLRDESNIYLNCPNLVVESIGVPDLLFLGGQDWPRAAELGLVGDRLPILSLIQNTHFGNANSPFRNWFRQRATRICVGSEVGQTVSTIEGVNGPLHTITNGVEPLDHLRLPYRDRTIDVLISGHKDPVLARSVEAELSRNGLAVMTLTEHCPRAVFLETLRAARIAVLLTLPQEGSFLPALEAMGLDVAVICPETQGIHSFCRHEETAILPDKTAPSLAQAVRRLQADAELSAYIRATGYARAQQYTLERERAAFLPILEETLGL